MFTTNTTSQRADQSGLIMDQINAFDMTIYQNLQKETYVKRERSLSNLSDMSEEISHILPQKVQEEEEEEDICCICFEILDIKKNYCVTPCGHPFCFMCIVKTMAKQNSCPCCRASLYQEVEDLRSSDQEETFYANVVEEYDDQSIMNASMTSNLMIAQNEHQQYLHDHHPHDLVVEGVQPDNSDVFPNLPRDLDGLQPRNLQNMFDDVGDDVSQHDRSLNDLFISALMPDDMEIDTDMSVSLPTYISQEDENSDDRSHRQASLARTPLLQASLADRRSGEFRRDAENVVEASCPNHRLEQWPPQTESERARYPNASEAEEEEEEEHINVSDILPPSMDNIPTFGDNMILSLHARMRSEGYTMLDVLMIILMKMYPEEIRQDLASYRCARGLNSIIQDLQNETKEKELFAMEDRNMIVL